MRCPSTSINNACNRKNGCLLPVISAKSVVPTRCPVFDAYPAFGRILQAKSCGPSPCRKLHQRISSHVDDPKDLIPQRLCDHEVPRGTRCSLHDQPCRDSTCGNVSILKKSQWMTPEIPAFRFGSRLEIEYRDMAVMLSWPLITPW